MVRSLSHSREMTLLLYHRLTFAPPPSCPRVSQIHALSSLPCDLVSIHLLPTRRTAASLVLLQDSW